MDQIGNWLGKLALLASALLCFIAAIGYGLKGDWQRAAEAFFLGCLEAAVTL